MPKDPQKVIKNPDLHLVEDDAMIEELASRHPECFILWAEKLDGTGKVKRSRYHGDLSRLLGVGERIYRHFLRKTDRADKDD